MWACTRIRALRERQTRREAGGRKAQEPPGWEVAGLSNSGGGQQCSALTEGEGAEDLTLRPYVYTAIRG
jgi:hypothetical protein